MRKYKDANVVFNKKGMDYKDWLMYRKKGIGGSDAASIFEVSPYKSPVNVYVDKTSEEIHENNELKLKIGREFKNFIAKEFSLITGKKVRNINGILKNDKYPFALGNIDKGVVGEKAFLECKVNNIYSKKDWEKGVPPHYEIQCHHYMGITGATHCYIAALIGFDDIVIHKIDRNEEIIDSLMETEERFWSECILGDKMPLPDGSEEYSKYLKTKYKETKDESLIFFMEEDKLSRYDEVLEHIKKLEVEKKSIEQHIQNEMKEYETAYIGDRKITWKSQSRSSIDSKRLKKEHPELVKQYMKTTNSRVFKVY